MTTPCPAREAVVERATLETSVRVELRLDEPGQSVIATGLGFLDHMLATFARHAGVQLQLRCTGDLQVDDHHSVEDCALTLGAALDKALGDRAGVVRFGSALAPMDEALARAAVDLSGRGLFVGELGLVRERLGDVSCENIPHFFRSLATSARLTLHLDLLRGANDHHRAEAAFKAFALALRQAVVRSGAAEPPSVKGSL